MPPRDTPALPPGDRVAGYAIEHLRAVQGYSSSDAKKAVRDVLAAIGDQKAHLPPWFVDWLRTAWRHAAGVPPQSPGTGGTRSAT